MSQSRRRSIRLYLSFFLLFFLIVVGCAKKKAHQEKSFPVNPSFSPDGSGEVAALFPHPEGWEGAGSHGIWVNQKGTKECLLCHQTDPDTISPAPACHSCHAVYPHEENWTAKENHGATVLAQGKNGCATLCHGSDLQGGLSQISCNRCHTIFPHASNWREGGGHGVAAKGEGKLLCRSCHGDDLLGGKAKVSCYQCHELYPHESDWSSPDRHGAFVAEEGKAVCATTCHGSDLSGGLSQVSCTQCHQLYPHSEKWDEGHRRVAMEVGKNACTRCHGDDFKKELGGKNCYSCHADYPHPVRERWIPFQGGHGEKVQSEYDGKTDSCERCHGQDLSRRIGEQNCASCHPAYPIAHRQEGWRRYEGHGAVTPSVYPYTDCQLCHGTEYQGLRGNRSCYDCHNRFPHLPGWRRESGEPQDHGEFVRNNSNVGCATSRCHGENLVPTEIARGANCRRCHEGYPHRDIDEWRRPTGHGADVLSNGLTDSEGNPRCLQCHDRERGGTYGARSCQSANCHSVYPHERMDNWETNHGSEAVGRDVRNRRCGGCHSDNFRRVLGGVHCYSCHINFPHPEDQPGGGCPLDGEGEPSCWTGTWTTEREVCTEEEDPICSPVSTEHPSPHAEQYLDQQESGLPAPDPNNPAAFNQCSRCHGDDYAGGASGIGCSSCHRGYPHRAQPEWRTDQGGTHTQTYLDGTRGTNSPCALCHRNLRGGIEARATSCAEASCHADYPHIDANWASPGRASQHASRVIMTRNASSCRRCHGDDFGRVVGEGGGNEGIRCLDCHPRGVATHERVGEDSWYEPEGHGAFYSSRYNAVSLEADCGNCHGRPVSFTESDTVATLRDRSQATCDGCRSACYVCHRAYPHVSVTSGGREYPWEPVNTAECGSRNTNNSVGHVMYLLNSPLFTDPAGNRPSGGIPWIGDPAGAVWINAINHTCGGEGGNCHSGGNRSYRTASNSVLCGSVCHNSSRPFPPELPDCSPPSADQTISGPPFVVSTFPIPNATTVVLGSTILVTFSEAMQRNTLAPSGAFFVEKISDGSRVEGRVTCSPDWCRTATLTPLAPLSGSTGYRGRILTDARDWDGTPLPSEYRWNFTTLTPDTTRPLIVSTNPTDGAAGILISTTTVTVNFNEAMSRASVESPTVLTLSKRIWNTRRRRWEWVSVSGSASCRTATCQTVDFTIAASQRPLSGNTVYRATMTTNASDLAGNRLATDYVWTFTTEEDFE